MFKKNMTIGVHRLAEANFQPFNDNVTVLSPRE